MSIYCWSLVTEILGGIGSFLLGLSAFVTLFIQYGYRSKANKIETKLMNVVYRTYMANEEGIVCSDYPQDAQKIISRLSKKTGLDTATIKKLLDRLVEEQKI